MEMVKDVGLPSRPLLVPGRRVVSVSTLAAFPRLILTHPAGLSIKAASSRKPS